MENDFTSCDWTNASSGGLHPYSATDFAASVFSYDEETVFPLYELDVPKVLIPSENLQDAVLMAPMYMGSETLKESTNKVLASAEVVAPSFQRNFVFHQVLNELWPVAGDALIGVVPLTLEAYETVRLYIDGARRVFGDVLEYLRQKQNEKAQSVFTKQGSVVNLFKSLFKPLDLIPQSIRPIEVAA